MNPGGGMITFQDSSNLECGQGYFGYCSRKCYLCPNEDECGRFLKIQHCGSVENANVIELE